MERLPMTTARSRSGEKTRGAASLGCARSLGPQRRACIDTHRADGRDPHGEQPRGNGFHARRVPLSIRRRCTGYRQPSPEDAGNWPYYSELACT